MSPDAVREPERRAVFVLTRFEKWALPRLAAGLPSWVLPDHLTLLGILAATGVAAAYALSNRDPVWLWVASAGLVVHWFGDSLDGTLARVRHIERPRYGYYVDHLLDIVGTTMLIVGLACSGYMNPVIALSVLVAYLVVSGEIFLATSTRGVFRMSSFGVGPTELRVLLAIGTIQLPGNPQVPLGGFGQMPLFDFGGLIAIRSEEHTS